MEWSITCDGSTESATGVVLDAYLYDDDEIEVILKTIATGAETTLTKTTDYTVSGVPGATAAVKTTANYTSASALYVRRTAVLTQTDDLVTGDSIPSEVIEQILDKDVMALQVINDKASRGLQISKTSDLSDLSVVPVAGQVFGMNAANDALIMYPSTASGDASLADLLSPTGFGVKIYPQEVQVGSTGIKIVSGSGDPNGSVTGNIGSIYLRTDGGEGTAIYKKESGNGNTGWIKDGIPTAARGFLIESPYGFYESKNLSTSAQEADVSSSIAMNTDGTTLFVMGTTDKVIYQYTLSTAWDISTAAYASKSKDVSSEDGTPRAITFKTDGTKLYVVGQDNDAVFQYTLSTAWDISTAAYDSKSGDISGEITGGGWGVRFKPDGASMFVMDNGTDDAFQYTLSTPWDVSTASYASKTFDFTAKDNSMAGIAFNSDGTKIFVTGRQNDKVYRYSLGTAYDISTASDDSVEISVGTVDTVPYEVVFSSSGDKMFLIGATNKKVYQYNTGFLYRG
jgi:6-phosphogluconolactonase (cycloisomerase 2 family)